VLHECIGALDGPCVEIKSPKSVILVNSIAERVILPYPCKQQWIRNIFFFPPPKYRVSTGVAVAWTAST
jgi:hypothetical protein